MSREQSGSHVYLEATGLSVSTENGQAKLHIDEASGLVFAVKGQEVLSYSLAHPSEQPQVTHIGEGPPVAALAASCDGGTTLALQRSPAQLQVMQRVGRPCIFVQSPQARVPLLGFFWTRSNDGDFVMVTHIGLEVYSMRKQQQKLTLAYQQGHPILWCKYCHSARLLLLGTGDIGLWLQAYQFTEQGSCTKLPPFQISAVTPAGTDKPPASSQLDPMDITLAVLYGRIYCSYLDRRAKKLHLYRFYADAVVPQQAYTMPGASMALSVADNLLLTHHLRTGVALVIDVCFSPAHPLAPPLPIGLPPESTTAASRKHWRMAYPNVVLDSSGAVMRCSVDVGRIVSTLGADPRAAVGFLLRRRPSANPSADITTLIIGILKMAVVEHVPLTQLRSILDDIHAAVKEATSGSPPAVTPQDVLERVWGWLHSEEATDAATLQAAVAQCTASCAAAHVPCPAGLHALAVDIALQQSHGPQVAASLAGGHVASQHAAQLVACLQASPSFPQAAAVSLRLLLRAGQHSQACHLLLQNGQVIQAMRYAARHQLQDPSSAAFLAKAVQSGDVHVMLSVLQHSRHSVDSNMLNILQPVRDQLPAAWQQRLPEQHGSPAIPAQ